MEDGHDVLRVPLPALFTVVKDINEPRLPSLKGKMKAKKAEITVWGAADLDVDPAELGLDGSPTRVMKIFAPELKAGGVVFEGETGETVPEARGGAPAGSQRRGAVARGATPRPLRADPGRGTDSGEYRVSSIEVVQDRCVGCELCVSACLYDAIEMKDGLAVINDNCTLCGACVDACKFDAIILRQEQQEAVSLDDYRGVWVVAEQRNGELNDVSFELLGEGTRTRR